MKRLLSIALFGLLLYNMLGYSVVYMAMNDDVIVTNSEQINGDETLTIKTVMSLPYQSDWSGYEPAQGRLQRGDNIYQMLERKVVNDTLYTVCKVDYSAREHFLDLANHIADNITDSADSPLKKSAKLLKNFIKEYHSSNRSTVFYVYEWLAETTITVQPNAATTTSYNTLHSPPPEVC